MKLMWLGHGYERLEKNKQIMCLECTPLNRYTLDPLQRTSTSISIPPIQCVKNFESWSLDEANPTVQRWQIRALLAVGYDLHSTRFCHMQNLEDSTCRSIMHKPPESHACNARVPYQYQLVVVRNKFQFWHELVLREHHKACRRSYISLSGPTGPNFSGLVPGL